MKNIHHDIAISMLLTYTFCIHTKSATNFTNTNIILISIEKFKEIPKLQKKWKKQIYMHFSWLNIAEINAHVRGIFNLVMQNDATKERTDIEFIGVGSVVKGKSKFMRSASIHLVQWLFGLVNYLLNLSH